MTIERRRSALQDLVQLRLPLPLAISQLRGFPWDSDEELITLTGDDLDRVINKCKHGELSSSEVEGWAEAIEGRDDIGYEPHLAQALRQVIFALANPQLAGRLEADLASQWRKRLGDR